MTCDLPVIPVTPQLSWNDISDIPLADPDYGPGRINQLLGVDIFIASLLHGWRVGPRVGSPTAFETKFGWVPAGLVESQGRPPQVATHHASLISGDDLRRKFWEIEESPGNNIDLPPEERAAVSHLKENHCHNKDGQFIVPLPKKLDPPSLGESRSQAVESFLSLERSLQSKNEFSAFNSMMQEYFDLCHAEPVPGADLEKPEKGVFFLPTHTVKKESSTTTKIRAMFDASARSSSAVSLKNLLLVEPTVHSPLIDVLLNFQLHRVALTTDVSNLSASLLSSKRTSVYSYALWSRQFIWNLSRIWPQTPSSLHSDTSLLVAANPLSFGATMEPTLVLPISWKNQQHSSITRRHEESSPILFYSRHLLEIYPWMCSTLWGFVGICGEVHENPSPTRHLWCETHIRGVHQNHYTSRSRCLVSIPCNDDGIEPLTPGHFLIGKPLKSIPDSPVSYRPVSLLRCWHLCQSLVRHFWKRWSTEYLSMLRHYTKWHHPTRCGPNAGR